MFVPTVQQFLLFSFSCHPSLVTWRNPWWSEMQAWRILDNWFLAMVKWFWICVAVCPKVSLLSDESMPIPHDANENVRSVGFLHMWHLTCLFSFSQIFLQAEFWIELIVTYSQEPSFILLLKSDYHYLAFRSIPFLGRWTDIWKGSVYQSTGGVPYEYWYSDLIVASSPERRFNFQNWQIWSCVI